MPKAAKTTWPSRRAMALPWWLSDSSVRRKVSPAGGRKRAFLSRRAIQTWKHGRPERGIARCRGGHEGPPLRPSSPADAADVADVVLDAVGVTLGRRQLAVGDGAVGGRRRDLRGGLAQLLGERVDRGLVGAHGRHV